MAALAGNAGAKVLRPGDDGVKPDPFTIVIVANPALEDEIFGPTSLIVACRDESELLEVTRHVEGQLTATVHAASDDRQLAALGHRVHQHFDRFHWNAASRRSADGRHRRGRQDVEVDAEVDDIRRADERA